VTDAISQAVPGFDTTANIDSLTDLDLFGMFDPGLELDGFDAYLESTLNPTFPVGF
jgi:hypothetical protein